MSSADLQTIGLALKNYRKKSGLTQSAAAERAGISRQNISDIERGVFLGAISTLQKYLRFAGLQLRCQQQSSEFPQLDELQGLFGDDE